MAEKRRVTFANHYTDAKSGKRFDQGKTYELDAPLARLVVNIGKARDAEPDEKTTSRPKPAGDEK